MNKKPIYELRDKLIKYKILDDLTKNFNLKEIEIKEGKQMKQKTYHRFNMYDKIWDKTVLICRANVDNTVK